MKPTLLSHASEQARTAQLFSHVRDGVVMLDPVGVVGFWSAGTARLYGRLAPSALGQCYLDLLPPRCRVVQIPLIHKALEGDETSAEWQTTRPDGAIAWVAGDFRPVFDDFGKRVGCVILLHDVTKWRTADAARRASEELLRTITDNIPGAVYQYRVAADGRPSFPFVSRGVAELLERMPAELISTAVDFNALIDPDDRSAFWQSFEQSRATLDPWDVEFRVHTARTGQLKWIRSRAVPTRQPDGGTLWNGVLADVSDRVAVAEALREKEARYRLLTENATDLISRLDPDGVFLYASPVTATMFGVPPDAVVGKHIREFVVEDDLPRVIEVFDRVLSRPAVETFVFRARHASGAHLWCESTARGVRDTTGEVTEVVTVTRSIEERKKLEAKVQNSLKMEAVGRLAGGVAHDFNNLLTVINGFSEMILRNIGTQDPSRTASQVREIRKAGERASSLTRQLLAFGRQQIQTRSRLNLNTVVNDTLKMLARLIGEDIEIELDLCPDVGHVSADVGQVEQVLMNLVVNARDAMPDGGDLTIRTENVRFDRSPDEDVRPGDYVAVSVTDSGCGMDEATRARVFEPFFTTKELGKGTGLGLAMVYGIVKQSDGHIAVESEPSRGTTFRVYLPRCDAMAEGDARRRKDAILLGRETVLLVEDDEGVRAVASAMLRTLGYRVVEAPGGLEALRTCREYPGPIHLLLTDVVMPMMNGREVADRVRVLVPGVKVLFMSGYTDDSILRHGVLDEGVSFLNKPLSHESLSRKLREVLDPIPAAGGAV